MQTKTYTGHNGLQLTADVGGDADSFPVILLHGGGQTRHSWHKAAIELIELGFHVISLDLRGHGDSEWAKDKDYSFEALASDLNAIAVTLSQPPAFVGASMGGVTSLLTAANYPNVASAIILVDVVPRMKIDGMMHIQNFMQAHDDGFLSVDDAANAVAAYLPHRPKPSNTKGLMKNLRKADDGRLYWHWDPAVISQGGANKVESMVLKMEAAAKKITIPTLIVRGDKSELVDEQGVKSLQALITHAEYIDIADARHMVAGDNNDAFNHAVESFLKRLN